MLKPLAAIIICLLLSGCSGAQLKDGGLYVNQNTCLGMDDFGVAKVKNEF